MNAAHHWKGASALAGSPRGGAGEAGGWRGVHRQLPQPMMLGAVGGASAVTSDLRLLVCWATCP